MRRKQLYLDEASEHALKRLAAATGRSEASHVRDALQEYLGRQASGQPDAIERLIGLVNDPVGPDDVAEHHDHYLYGAPKPTR